MKFFFTFIAVCGVSVAAAEVRLPALISSGMVVQRDAPITLWGWADAGERIRITFRDEERSVRADRSGRWLVRLGPRPAGGPYEMTIAGANRVTLNDILIGDVWLASGQSNMEWPVRDGGMSIDDAERELARATLPELRLFAVDHQIALTPQTDVGSSAWTAARVETVAKFSAVAILFGRELHERYGVPVGLIQSSWSGTPAESWMSEQGLRAVPELHETANSLRAVAKELTPFVAPDAPSVIFNRMIQPLTPFGVKGVIWYQGESNASDERRALQYRALFPALIRDWRSAWGSELPFLFVQLAGFGANQNEPAEYPWALLREAQDATLSLPRTGMASAVDIGNERDIHPTNKQDVAHRLVLAAAAVAYGENVVHSGPRYRSMRVAGACIDIEFSDVGAGLWIKDKYGYARGFEIAAADGVFKWAQARLAGDAIRVCSAAVDEPAAVRYDWANTPDGNLYNREGLPALPFRTSIPTRAAPRESRATSAFGGLRVSKSSLKIVDNQTRYE
ncbi:MAG: sialate O-acetylesterase [Gammaproteobacteria bacterium]